MHARTGRSWLAQSKRIHTLNKWNFQLFLLIWWCMVFLLLALAFSVLLSHSRAVKQMDSLYVSCILTRLPTYMYVKCVFVYVCELIYLLYESTHVCLAGCLFYSRTSLSFVLPCSFLLCIQKKSERQFQRLLTTSYVRCFFSLLLDGPVSFVVVARFVSLAWIDHIHMQYTHC